MAGPANLTELAAITDDVERAKAALVYEHERTKAIDRSREIRDDAIRKIVTVHGVTKTARLVGMSVSHVKAVRSAP